MDVLKTRKKQFDSESACKKEFLKTKIMSHDNEVTGFYEKIFLRLTLITRVLQ